MSETKKQPEKVSVVLRGSSRGHEDRAKVTVSAEKADRLLRDGLADPA